MGRTGWATRRAPGVRVFGACGPSGKGFPVPMPFYTFLFSIRRTSSKIPRCTTSGMVHVTNANVGHTPRRLGLDVHQHRRRRGGGGGGGEAVVVEATSLGVAVAVVARNRRSRSRSRSRRSRRSRGDDEHAILGARGRQRRRHSAVYARVCGGQGLVESITRFLRDWLIIEQPVHNRGRYEACIH